MLPLSSINNRKVYIPPQSKKIMTKKETKNADFKKVIENLDRINELDELAEKRADDRTEEKEKADKKLREYAVESEKEINPDYNGTPEQLTQDELKSYLEARKTMAVENASSTLKDNLADIVEKQIPGKTLEKLAGEIPIIQAAKDKDQKTLALYKQYQAVQDFAKFYEEEEKPRNEEEAKLLESAIIKGVRKVQRDRLKDKGFKDIDLLELADSLAVISVRAGHIDEKKVKKYAVEGLKEEAKERKKAYEDTGVDVKEAVRKALTKLANGDAGEFRLARDLIYKAETGNDDYFNRRYKSKD